MVLILVELHNLLKNCVKNHKRIIFNGNGYDEAWVKEATEVRGLLNYKTTPDCLPHLVDKKNVEMLTSLKVFSEQELKSRCEILTENYNKTVLIEAATMSYMTNKQILPAIEEYIGELAATAAAKKALNIDISNVYETETLKKLSELCEKILEADKVLKDDTLEIKAVVDATRQSEAIRDKLLGDMGSLRALCDEAEMLTADKYWPFPTYSDLLFGVR